MPLFTEQGDLIDIPEEAFQAYFADPNYIHYIGQLFPQQYRVADTLQVLEFTYYRPNTPRNDLLLLRMVELMGIVWSIASIPITEKAFMEDIARKNDVRIVASIPTVFDDEARRHFPLDSARIYTLEETRHHPVYQS